MTTDHTTLRNATASRPLAALLGAAFVASSAFAAPADPTPRAGSPDLAAVLGMFHAPAAELPALLPADLLLVPSHRSVVAGALMSFSPPSPPPVTTHECLMVALIARESAMIGARADYLHSIAVCVNDTGRFARCLRRLRDDLRAAQEHADEVFHARLRVCNLLNEGRYDPDLDPADFTPKINNRYWPLVPGRTLVYRKVDAEGTEIIRVTTLPDTVEIDGIECRVVRDVVRLDGEIIEDTVDWYSQHENGDVWYIGEIAQNFEDGLLDNLDGSWRSGRDDALPGIIMLANPRVGDVYRQEFYLAEAEDMGAVLSVDETVCVPAGTFRNCLKTEDWTPLEPSVREHKFYAPGVGTVLEINPDTGERLELIEIIDP